MALGAAVLSVLAACGRSRPIGARTAASSATPRAQGAPACFQDVTAASGITYRWPDQPKPLRIDEAIGGGCAFLDYDGDGWLDILLVGPDHVALYRNLHDGRFQDVSAETGLAGLRGRWTGCAVCDYDGDGWLDILLTGYHRLALLRNEAVTLNHQPSTLNPGRLFRDVTRAAGLDPADRGRWALSAGFMDLDGSGRLALVLTNYVDYGPKDPPYCEILPGIRSGCPPNHYRPEYPELWRNVGGRFEEVTRAAGMAPLHGNAMTVAFADIAATGRMDFYIGNDGKPAELFRNLGAMRFRNAGEESGAAANNMGHAIAAMGADWGDYDRDGRPDLAVSAFSDEPYSLFRNAGRGLLDYASDRTGILGPTYTTLGFGAKWVDMDNDGWPDLAFANGHVYDNTDQLYPGTTFRQSIMLFHNEPGPQGRRFRDLVPDLGGDIARPIVGRGLAAGDFDNDGRMDLLVVDFEGAPMLLHNVSPTTNHWITFDLRSAGHNRFAYGATVTAQAGGAPGVWYGAVSPASSFLSSSDPRVHFGLGPARSLDVVEIRWPDGRRQTLRNVPADRIVRVDEG